LNLCARRTLLISSDSIFMMSFRRSSWGGGCAITILSFLFVICSVGPKAQAQVLYGSITGNVTDASNAPIPGAKIEALNVGTGIVTGGVTGVRGVYLINDLQPGMYPVTISAQGFATVVQENVQVDVNTERRMDVQLQLAQVKQQVTVTTTSEALQTDRTDVKSVLVLLC